MCCVLSFKPLVGHLNIFKYMNIWIGRKEKSCRQWQQCNWWLLCPPKFSMIFLSAVMVWITAIPPCQSASPPHQFLSRFPCIGNPNLDDCGVALSYHHHQLPWWWWNGREKNRGVSKGCLCCCKWGRWAMACNSIRHRVLTPSWVWGRNL